MLIAVLLCVQPLLSDYQVGVVAKWGLAPHSRYRLWAVSAIANIKHDGENGSPAICRSIPVSPGL